MWFNNLITAFVVGYPIFVSIIWIVGCLFSGLLRRWQPRTLLNTATEPFISILVPAHNEAETLDSAVQSLAELNYECYEVVLIDDCSDDETPAIMDDCKHNGPTPSPLPWSPCL